jgi:hypothetical protein
MSRLATVLSRVAAYGAKYSYCSFINKIVGEDIGDWERDLIEGTAGTANMSAVEAALQAGGGESSGKRGAGEPAALVGIEDFRLVFANDLK